MGLNEEIISTIQSHTRVTKVSDNYSIPPVATPPRSTTPPPALEKRKSERNTNEGNGPSNERAVPRSAAEIDPNALKKALKDFEDAGRHRDITPGGSPSRKRQRVYGDR